MEDALLSFFVYSFILVLTWLLCKVNLMRAKRNMTVFANEIGGTIQNRNFPIPHLFVTGVYLGRRVWCAVWPRNNVLQAGATKYYMSTNVPDFAPLPRPRLSENVYQKGNLVCWKSIFDDVHWNTKSESHFKHILDELTSSAILVELSYKNK